MRSTPTPFTIRADDAELDELRRRLKATRWADAETVADWSQGVPLAYLKELCGYWADGYDWRERERALNRFEQFTLEVMGLDVHFIHARSRHEGAAGLVITHGWPGSVVEFERVIEPLCDPTRHGGRAEDAFDVVCPSLPGYGFSAKPTAPGWGIERIADAWDELMRALGYERYFAQGGDWGAMVTTRIGIRDAGRCAGIHLNMPIVAPDPDTMDKLSDDERRALDDMQVYMDRDSGYSKQQSTRPQTLGYGLVDSPAGQAAWILEKFWRWTDCDGHPENAIDRDRLLDNVMLYWLTGTGASSARLYWESFASPPMDPVAVPVGCSIYPKEIFRSSRRWAEKRYGDKLRYWNRLERGGHFAAMEQPESFVRELRACFASMR